MESWRHTRLQQARLDAEQRRSARSRAAFKAARQDPPSPYFLDNDAVPEPRMHRLLRAPGVGATLQRWANPPAIAEWQICRAYLDTVEAAISLLVRNHSSGFCFHLDRRPTATLDAHDQKSDDTTQTVVRRIPELAYAKAWCL
ncbi:hypothetical protein [Bradyrhizobium glycinis]|uniref:hypothetical protein n=1 Tax=Bradyrhizobium glycinis TaxID=2751812 RepID=UPI0018D5C09F|nr:hypothetical protein [Bradyrhizobium glycinis]MBH5370593.1 hypothetical protein [Bradyrhizobium glycinis]